MITCFVSTDLWFLGLTKLLFFILISAEDYTEAVLLLKCRKIGDNELFNILVSKGLQYVVLYVGLTTLGTI